LDPKSSAAHCNLGVVLEGSGDLYGAESEFRNAVELDPNSTIALLDLGENLVHQRNGKEAVRSMEMVVGRDDTPDTRKLYGDSLVLAGRDDDAYQQYEMALKRDERNY